MATLIENYNWTDWLKVQKMGKLKELASGEVMFNGEFYFTFINPQTDFIRTQAEYLSQRGNTVGGKPIEEILGAEIAAV